MNAYVSDPDFTLYLGDVREVLAGLPDGSVDCCVTSPPYWGLRDYGHDGQIGLEDSPDAFVAELVAVFSGVRRVLADHGTLWLNLGDSYAGSRAGEQGETGQMAGRSVAAARCRVRTGGVADEIVRGKRDAKRWGGGNLPHGDGLKPKDLVGIPWRVAFALQADGWYLRSDIVWSKPNPMPESVTDRPTKSHEYVFLLSKSPRYFFDQESVREPHAPDGRKVTAVVGGDGSIQHRDGERWPNGGRNVRSVWEIATQPYAEAHFATYPEALVERCLKAGCPEGGTVLDPFMGSGTTAKVARRLGRKAVGVEINPEYAALAAKRLSQLSLLAEDAA